ncbi:MAG: PorT family protein [Bacteroidales bacterium]|nr:PorT family protein [Candidatus Cacconaster merdequi]
MTIRKITRILAIAAVLLTAVSTAEAQTYRFGPKGGLAIGWLPGTVINGDELIKPHNTFYAGVAGNAVFGNGFFMQAELLYAGRGHSDRGEIGGKYSRTLGYLQLPLLFGVEVLEDKIFLSAGPELGYLVTDKIKADLPSLSSEAAKFNLSIGLQATYLISDEFGIELKFDGGLNRTFKGTYGGAEDKAHNIGLQIGICYLFEL